MSESQKLLGLVEGALAALDSGTPASLVADAVLRIARLFGDSVALYRFSLETASVTERQLRSQIQAEVEARLGSGQIRSVKEAALNEFFEERAMDPHTGQELGESPIWTGTVAELEMLVTDVGATLASEWDADLAQAHHRNQVMLSRIRTRLHQYLSRVECALEVGAANADIFARNRLRVEARLSEVSPETLTALQAAERRADGDDEDRSQAGLSCRRALIQVADDLYPATGDTVICYDGKERTMTKPHYLQRLIQFAFEKSDSGTTRELLVAQLEKLCAYLEALDDLANKGVHESASEYEMNQCIIQTYLTVGEFIVLADAQPVTPRPTEDSESGASERDTTSV
jgi:hypothetical protein